MVIIFSFLNKAAIIIAAFANKVRDTCFESLVLMATSAAHERVQLTCTKGALMVVIKSELTSIH